MIKIEDKISLVICDICNKSCLADASDLSVYDYSTFVKVDGKSLNFCGNCTFKIESFINKSKNVDYLI
jgi:hypothetical protein